MKSFAGILLALVMIGSIAHAQEPTMIVVKKGQSIKFETHLDNSTTQSAMGQEKTTAIVSTSKTSLTAKNVSADSVMWVAKTSIKLDMDDPKNEGKKITKSSNSEPETFSTDAAGRTARLEATTSIAKNEADDALKNNPFSMLNRKNPYAIYFAPTIGNGRKVGDTWVESSRDTNQMGAAEGMSFTVRTTVEKKFTYDGIVDTLKQKAMRVRSETKSLAINGEGGGGGMTMQMEGDGTASEVMYYSTRDGMLLASTTDMEVDAKVTLSGGVDLIIPVLQRTKSVVLRKK